MSFNKLRTGSKGTTIWNNFARTSPQQCKVECRICKYTQIRFIHKAKAVKKGVDIRVYCACCGKNRIHCVLNVL